MKIQMKYLLTATVVLVAFLLVLFKYWDFGVGKINALSTILDLPILLPEAHRFKIRMATNSTTGDESTRVAFYVNGTKRHERELQPGWTDVEFDVPASGLNVGNNVVAVEAELAAHHAGADTLKPLPQGGEVGVAFGAMWLGFPR